VVGFPGFPAPEGLAPGTTYYWRVDEVNDADPNSPWKGAIWSFTIPTKEAYDPSPAAGVSFVLSDATLAWTPGFAAKLHHVYFGDNSDDVGNAAGAMPLPDASFDPGALELDKTYYWRVDEFDGTAVHKGNVWSFTTVPDIAVTNPDLQGWWTLDEGEGTTAVDWSGHGGHGSFVGEPRWVDGYQGSALELSGGDFLNCGENAGAGVTADFTLAAWVKMNPGNAGQYMGICGKLSRRGGNAEYLGYALVRYNENDFRLWVGDDTTDLLKSGVSSDVRYTDTEWHHVAGVHEGQANFLYVDGVKQAGSTMISFVPSDLFFQIGRQYSNTNTQRLFKGKIDDVRLYNKALTDAQIAEVMLGDPKQPGSPVPGRDALLDTRDISSLSWSRGNTAASHDVYFGTDRDAVAGADNNAPEFQGNQAGTSLSLASLVEFGGGDYYWRVDEVEAGGAVNAGTIWKFTVPEHLIVDNFESYNNIDLPNAGSNVIFDNWIDGFGTTTNGALVGNDLPPYAEQSTVRSGNQSMIYGYDNAGKTSEATLTLTKRDWTVEAVTKLSLSLRGLSANAADRVFVALNGTAVIYHNDPAATQLSGWNEWVIDLATFGVDLANVNSITIGIGTKNVPAADGGTGTMYFDDIRLIR
jgi:prepilin-type processing-associated H-X9-DG protein